MIHNRIGRQKRDIENLNPTIKMQSLKNICISVSGIWGIEFIEWQSIPEFFKFSGQTLIGVLTVYYLFLQIRKLRKEMYKK